MTKQKIKQLRNKTFLFIIVTISIIGGLRTYDDLQRNNQILDEKKLQIEQEIILNYANQINGLKSFLNMYVRMLSTSSEVKEFFKNKDREGLYNHIKPKFDTFKFEGDSVSKIHFHTKDHISFLRLHEKDRFGDNLEKVRPMISHAIKNQSITHGYEHGKHDIQELTYRVSYPIFDGEKFLGVVEVGMDSSRIWKKIEKKIEKLFNRSVKITYFIDANTPNFKEYEKKYQTVGGYFYKSSELMDKVLSKLDSLTQQDIKIDDKFYRVSFSNINLVDYKSKKIGDYFYILDITQDIKENRFFFYSSLAKPIIAAILIILLIGWIFYYFYKNFLKLEKRTRSILDAQSSLILLSDGETIIDCNTALLSFYGFNSLEKFKEKHGCICNTFLKGDNFLQKDNNGTMWVQYLLENSDDIIKVAIKDQLGNNNIFKIVLNQYEQADEINDEYYVITLTNISTLEKANAQLIEQSKQASLGEMIGNIAHQWRQPLSAIASIASSVAIKSEFGKITEEAMQENMDKIVHKTNYLSETIDTFRNFIKEEKVETTVILQDRIQTALNIVSASLESNHIKITNNLESTDPIELKLVLGELTQVIINIINNAKDAILEHDIKDGHIQLKIKDFHSYVEIIIKDNAGGIPEYLLAKIFEPYFTTKHQSVGTGLGLYMSYKIVNESMKGKLSVENTEEGAKFKIMLPKSK